MSYEAGSTECRGLIEAKESLIKAMKSLGKIKDLEHIQEKLRDVYNELESTHSGRFHDTESLQKAKLIDLLQELIEQHVEISTTPITGKWCEIDTEEDLQIAKNIFQN